MKKFMFLFLVVAFVAVMAGGAMATDPCPTCPTCPTCPPPEYTEDSIELRYDIYGIHCLSIDDDYIEFCGVVPCATEGPCIDSKCVDFTVKNTGCPGKLLAKVGGTEGQGFEFVVNEGGTLIWPDGTYKFVRNYAAGECLDDSLTVELRVYASAQCTTMQQYETLWLKVMKQ